MRQEEPATAVRDRLLAAGDEKYRAVRFRDASGKRAAQGISRGTDIVRSMDASGRAAAFLQAARQAIEAEKARVAGSPDDDQDGWLLGGLTSVMNLVDAELARPGAEKRRSRRLLWIAVALVAAAALAVLFLSATYTHVPESRLAGSELAAAASALRLEVQETMQETGKPPAQPAVQDTPHGRIELSVGANGAITAVNRKHGITIVLTPGTQGGNATWTCSGVPARDVPSSCR